MVTPTEFETVLQRGAVIHFVFSDACLNEPRNRRHVY
jgi:hypothetical protein